jgi:hypothetical protein
VPLRCGFLKQLNCADAIARVTGLVEIQIRYPILRLRIALFGGAELAAPR